MRVKITLACTECKQRNYNMTKEKKNHPERMETKKYCKFCRTHTLHKETKYLARGEKMAECGKSGKSGKESKKQKKSWFKGLKSEFNKIIWTDRVTLGKQTVAVVSITIVLGVVITILDSLVLQFMNLVIR